MLVYVNGVLTSVGSSSPVSTADITTQDLLASILLEIKVHNYILAHEAGMDDRIDEIRTAIAEEE